MAIDFPASPTNGQTFTSGSVTYTWDGVKWTAVAAGGGSTDKITEGNTSAEVIDTGSDGRFVVTTEGTERARVDSSGRLLVGTSSASQSAFLQVQGRSGALTDYAGFHLRRGSLPSGDGQALGAVNFMDNSENLGAQIYATSDGGSWTSGSNHRSRLVFSTTANGASSPTERMRINAEGGVLYGITSYPSGGSGGTAFRPLTNGRLALYMSTSSTAQNSLIHFLNPNGQVGEIYTNGSATSYITSSDYRLKENVVPLTGAADRLKQIPVHRFNFIADPETTVDGFLAHEAQAVVPECVKGTKDEVDADGNPVYQGIDQSKLVPLLTAALQEAIGEIESLKARVAALESA